MALPLLIRHRPLLVPALHAAYDRDNFDETKFKRQ
jgi:hypothetical protein